MLFVIIFANMSTYQHKSNNAYDSTHQYFRSIQMLIKEKKSPNSKHILYKDLMY